MHLEETGHELDRNDSGQGLNVDPCEYHNQPFASINDGEFLDQLRDSVIQQGTCSKGLS
jgi:hypothetical protein